MGNGNPRVELLLAMLDAAYEESGMLSMKAALKGITPEELQYRPVPEMVDALSDDEARGVQTIPLKAFHSALAKVLFGNHALGDGLLTRDTVVEHLPTPDPADEPAPLLAALDRAHQGLKDALRTIDDADLDKEVQSVFEQPLPAWRLVGILVQHDLWHAGQIATLRRMYALEQSRSQGDGT